MINCLFAFKCHQLWSDLSPTHNPRVRYCQSCQNSVHWADSLQEFNRLAKEQKCLAFLDGNLISLGFPEGHSEYFIVINQQYLQAKQLKFLKESRYFSHLSYPEIKDQIMRQEVTLEVGGEIEANQQSKLLLTHRINHHIVKKS